jgi:hypothetical protein
MSVDEVGEGPSMVSDSLPATFAAVCCTGERLTSKLPSLSCVQVDLLLDCLRSVLALFRRVVVILYETVESVQARRRLVSAAGNLGRIVHLKCF